MIVETANTAAMNLRDIVKVLSRGLKSREWRCGGQDPDRDLPVRTMSDHRAKTGNNHAWLSNIRADVIEFSTCTPQVDAMKHAFALLLCLAFGWPAVAQAACYADYKAKQDSPLRLHYGVAEISGDCTKPAATRQLQPRLQQAGWTLLNVMSVFDETGLAERKDSAGPHFLRY